MVLMLILVSIMTTFLLTGLNFTVTSLWVGTGVQKSLIFNLTVKIVQQVTTREVVFMRVKGPQPPQPTQKKKKEIVTCPGPLAYAFRWPQHPRGWRTSPLWCKIGILQVERQQKMLMELKATLLSYSSLWASLNMVTVMSLFSGTGQTHIPM